MHRTVVLTGSKKCLIVRMRQVPKELAKLEPEPRPSRLKIMAEHMIAMRGKRDLESRDLAVVIWKIANTRWACIKFLDDLPSSPKEAAPGWNLDFRLYCGRIEIVANCGGGHDFVVNHTSPKADPTGTYRHDYLLPTWPASEQFKYANSLQHLFPRNNGPRGDRNGAAACLPRYIDREGDHENRVPTLVVEDVRGRQSPTSCGQVESLRIGGAITLIY